MLFAQCELCPNNEVAIRRNLRLSEKADLSNPFIIEQDRGILWSTPELLLECDRRRNTAKVGDEKPGSSATQAQALRR